MHSSVFYLPPLLKIDPSCQVPTTMFSLSPPPILSVTHFLHIHNSLAEIDSSGHYKSFSIFLSVSQSLLVLACQGSVHKQEKETFKRNISDPECLYKIYTRQHKPLKKLQKSVLCVQSCGAESMMSFFHLLGKNNIVLFGKFSASIANVPLLKPVWKYLVFLCEPKLTSNINSHHQWMHSTCVPC